VSTTAIALDKETLLEDLIREHRRLDEQVRELEKRISLSPAEQLEVSRLKKQKLLTKDRIARLQT
jgi:uncharacterized protein YdcH (DUF465 family)